MRTRRGKRNRTTHHDQPVLYSTLQAGEQDTLSNTLPTGEHQQDNYNTGGQYDEVVIKPKPQPSIPSGYEVIGDYRENKKMSEVNNKRKATDTFSPNKLYAQPDKEKSKEKHEEEMMKEDIQDPKLLYAKVEKPKKKGKEKKLKEKDEQDKQGKQLYAEVNKPKKKGKKDKAKLKQAPQQSEERQQEAVSSQTGPGYEPSADGDSTPQQQDGEGNTTQPTPSATVEGLYAEVDKTQKKNKKKDEE